MKQTTNYYSHTRPEVATFLPEGIKTILDIGCGKGAFMQLIKEQTGAETWGVELVTEVAEKAKGRIDNILIGKIEDVHHLIPEGYFDCIMFNDVLEHLLEPTDILKMIKSKLSRNGLVIASIPNVRYFFNLYELVVKKDWEYKNEGILDSTHFRFFTQKSMKRMFEQAGYNVINQKGINEIKSWKFRFLNFMFLGYFNDAKYLQFICLGTQISK